MAVLGAGAFGTALAIQLSRRGAPTFLWGRDATAMANMQESRENVRHLRGCALPAPLVATAGLDDAVARSGDLLIATPSPALRETCERLAPLIRPEQGVACACKGLEPGSGRLAHEVVAEVLGARRPVAIISGPTFARELGLGLPTAVTVASADPAFAERMAAALHGDGFRAYTSSDVTGVEIGGAAKNVIAIAVGIADGLGLGANTRAALNPGGHTVISGVGGAIGAAPETLMGLAGLGDLVLTCTDDQSRNRRYGLMLGPGQDPGAGPRRHRRRGGRGARGAGSAAPGPAPRRAHAPAGDGLRRAGRRHLAGGGGKPAGAEAAAGGGRITPPQLQPGLGAEPAADVARMKRSGIRG